MTSYRVCAALVLTIFAGAHASEPLTLQRKIALPGVEGRIDHMILDATGKRLWIAALSNDSVEVVDLDAGERIKHIEGVLEPTGMALWPQKNYVIVASGEDDMLRAFDNSFHLVSSIKGLDDADNLRFDPVKERAVVGYANGALAVVDIGNARKVGNIKLAGHPESFQLDPDGRRIYVNVPPAGHVAVVDRDKSEVVATWPLTPARANYPMALDAQHGRLFVGCRRPSRLLVLDVATGKQVAALDVCGDADDVFYDPADKRIYASGGAGCVSVFAQNGADDYRDAGRVSTAGGARTSLYVPKTKTLYLAVPHRGKQQAAIWEYKAQP